MTRIPGAFLTHDGYLSAAIFCLQQYARVWPNCPIEFLIPVNSQAAAERIVREAPRTLAIKIVPCALPFRATFTALDEAAGDATWIFWCSSDRYPTLALPEAINTIAQELTTRADDLPSNVDALRIVRWRDSRAIDASADPILFGGQTFMPAPRTNVGFWHPQFLQKAWLRTLVGHLHEDATLLDIQKLIARLNKANEQSLNKQVVAIPSLALMKLEEPIRQSKATVNYAARQARKGGDVDELEIEGASVAYSCVRAHQANPYWEHANIDPAKALCKPMRGSVSVRVVSPGGVGSKQISSWLNAEGESQARSLAHSHVRIPPTTLSRGEKCVYVFGDPRNVAISIFNRRRVRHEGHGFDPVNPVREQPAPNFAILHASHLQSFPGDMTEDWDLVKFLHHRVDAFRLEEHFDFWLSADAPYEVVFVRYETLRHHAATLGAYLGVVTPPPPFRRRASDWTTLAQPMRLQINELYGDFARRLKALPDLFRMRGLEASLLDGTRVQFTRI